MLNQVLEQFKKPKAVIFDLDGVIVDSSERFKRLNMDAFEKRNKKEFVKSVRDYNSDCFGDTVIDTGMNLLKLYSRDHKVFFITARGSEGHAPTLNWIRTYFEHFDNCEAELIMNPEDTNAFEFTTQFDHAEFKKKAAEKILKSYEVILAVDDSDLNCRAYISLGIPTIQLTIPYLGRVLV
jgi:FMN phosphatase YigB (HAD superfamily)